MKKIGIFAFVAALFISFAVADISVAGALVRNGSGVRTKSIFGTLYYLSLYVPGTLKGKSGKEIIEANEAMYLVLTIDSSLVTRERFVETTSDGFAKSAASGYASAKKAAFLAQFNKSKFSKGDVVLMSYTPAGLTTTYKKKEVGKDGKVTFKAEVLGTIAGLDLKKSLFAIWLGSNPVQESLKTSLLSGK
ncbi:MAG TPA: chalcone isomerase family protein [Spirochaetota bacterium]|nr:chalcone isomerase family protein [Spirochaetota bacterium]